MMETRDTLRAQPAVQTLDAADEETIRLLAEQVIPTIRK